MKSSLLLMVFLVLGAGSSAFALDIATMESEVKAGMEAVCLAKRAELDKTYDDGSGYITNMKCSEIVDMYTKDGQLTENLTLIANGPKDRLLKVRAMFTNPSVTFDVVFLDTFLLLEPLVVQIDKRMAE